MSQTGSASRLVRARVAAGSSRAASAVSRSLRLGDGTVIGGRLALAIAPFALRELSRGRQIALVSGTNGKTTTTRLLACALGSAGPVATNAGGANMEAGLVAALAGAGEGWPGALEVDEAWLARALRETGAGVVVALNMTRDQLDRVSEVRRTAARWREALERCGAPHVVANADDPIVAWAALGAPGEQITWVAAGQGWRADSAGCPACEGRIAFGAEGWSCSACGFARPAPHAWIDGGELALADGRRFEVAIGLPGRFNVANAATAALAAARMGVEVGDALAAMRSTSAVAGRYQLVPLGPPGSPEARLLLAKNPAGWAEMLEVLVEPPAPVVLAINARLADGRDPSWLWDVPFERLRGRRVVATGERRLDLAVRLAYAEVVHEVVASPLRAVAAAARWWRAGDPPLDVVANYTAFQELRRALPSACGSRR